MAGRGELGETAGLLPVLLPGWRSAATVISALMRQKNMPQRLVSEVIAAPHPVPDMVSSISAFAAPQFPPASSRMARRYQPYGEAMTNINPQDLADRYIALWTEPDAALRRKAIQHLWRGTAPMSFSRPWRSGRLPRRWV